MLSLSVYVVVGGGLVTLFENSIINYLNDNDIDNK